MCLRGRSFLPALFAVLGAVFPISPGSAAAGESKCHELYFGIAGTPDFAEAWKCCEAEGMFEFLILMRLNGEGVTADAARAEELYRAWEKTAPDEAGSLQGEALARAIQERRKNPRGPHPRLDYCRDVAGDTMTINFCGDIEARIAKHRLQSVLADTKARLNAGQAALFDKLAAAYTAFEEADGRRMYQQYIDGTIRNSAAFGQESFVREQFLQLVEETVTRRGLKPSTREDLQAADDELNRVYREGIRQYSEVREGLISSDGSAQEKAFVRQTIEEYRKASKEAQLRWIRYRDLWADLARSLYPRWERASDPAVSMKTAVTKIRVLELGNDPVH